MEPNDFNMTADVNSQKAALSSETQTETYYIARCNNAEEQHSLRYLALLLKRTARSTGHVSRRGTEPIYTALVVRDLVVVFLVTLPGYNVHSVYCRRHNMNMECYWKGN
jgi:hypothetical protein